MTADRSTEEGWLRKMEKAADEHEPGDSDTWRAVVFRQMLQAAWAAGWERGYNDCRDDTYRAQRAAEQAAKETT